MKPPFRICIWSAALLLTTSLAFARADSKGATTGNATRVGGRLYRLDATYSVHNYKQPNKAALARRFNLDQLQILDLFAPSAQPNYKQPSIVSASKAVRLMSNRKKQPPASVGLAANYKRQAP